MIVRVADASTGPRSAGRIADVIPIEAPRPQKG